MPSVDPAGDDEDDVLPRRGRRRYTAVPRQRDLFGTLLNVGVLTFALVFLLVTRDRIATAIQTLMHGVADPEAFAGVDLPDADGSDADGSDAGAPSAPEP